jgi:hypothetical protein
VRPWLAAAALHLSLQACTPRDPWAPPPSVLLLLPPVPSTCRQILELPLLVVRQLIRVKRSLRQVQAALHVRAARGVVDQSPDEPAGAGMGVEAGPNVRWSALGIGRSGARGPSPPQEPEAADLELVPPTGTAASALAAQPVPRRDKARSSEQWPPPPLPFLQAHLHFALSSSSWLAPLKADWYSA